MWLYLSLIRFTWEVWSFFCHLGFLRHDLGCPPASSYIDHEYIHELNKNKNRRAWYRNSPLQINPLGNYSPALMHTNGPRDSYQEFLPKHRRNERKILKSARCLGTNIQTGNILPSLDRVSAGMVLGVAVKYWDKQGQRRPVHIPRKEYQRTKKRQDNY